MNALIFDLCYLLCTREENITGQHPAQIESMKGEKETIEASYIKEALLCVSNPDKFITTSGETHTWTTPFNTVNIWQV